MSLRNSTRARLVDVLVLYDGPQLVLLENDHDETLIAHAIEKQGYKYPIFAAQIKPRFLERYLAGKVDLRFLFINTPQSRLYFGDLESLDDSSSITLRKAKEKDLVEDIYPEAGIFSTVHTHPAGGL